MVDLGMLMVLNLFMKCSGMAPLTPDCDGCEGVNSPVVVSLGSGLYLVCLCSMASCGYLS